MDCKEVESLLSGKPYAELPPKLQAELVAHITDCAACRGRWLSDPGTQELRDAVQSVSPRKSVKAQVMDRLEQEAGQGGSGTAGEAADQPKTIGGFELIGKIGRGGMGTVFKARQISMDRIVALKVLSPKLAKDEPFVQRFLREARSAAQLNHPNIVQGIDAGFADGCYYFAMEYVDGITVRRLMTGEGRIEEAKALKIILGVTKALEHAHKHAIVHRDIKPENIMISRGGLVKLADLGLARSFSKPDTVTMHGATLGTPYYMSPEQARGKDDIDTRSDIYALGATLFHMLTGEFPFEGPSPAVILAKHITEDIPSPKSKNPALSTGVCDLVRRMMAKDPQRRPQTPAVLLQQIRELLERISVTPPSMTAPTERMGAVASDGPSRHAAAQQRRRQIGWLPWVGVGGLLIALVLLAHWAMQSGQNSRLEQAKAEYDSALVLYRRDVDDLDGAASRFRTIITKYPDSDYARRAKEEIEAIERKKQSRSQPPQPKVGTKESPTPTVKKPSPEEIAFQRTRGQLAELLKKRDFKGAEKLLAASVSAKRFPRDRIDELWLTLFASAQKAIEEIDTRAQALCNDGKYDEAKEAYRTALAWGIKKVRPSLERGIAEVERARKAAQEQARADAKAHYAAAFKGHVKPLLAERRYKEAKDALEKLAGRKEFKLAQEEIDLPRKDVTRLISLWEKVERSAASLKPGDRIRVKGMQVPFKGYDAGTIRYALGAAEAGITLVRMNAKDILALLGKGFFQDDETRLQGALFLLYDGQPDPEEAKALLAKVEKAPDVQRYRLLIKGAGVRDFRADEKAAQAAFAALRRAAAKTPNQVGPLIADFREGYRHTRFFNEHLSELAAVGKGPKQAPRSRSKVEWRGLLQGDDLTGWVVLNNNGTWKVESGEIVGQGSYTSIVNKFHLKPPYTLSLEVKVDRAGGHYYSSALLFGVKRMKVGSRYSLLLYNLPGHALRLCYVVPGVPTSTVWSSRETRFPGAKWHKLLLLVGRTAVALRCDGHAVFVVDVKEATDGAVGLLASHRTRFRNIRCADGLRRTAPDPPQAPTQERKRDDDLARLDRTVTYRKAGVPLQYAIVAILNQVEIPYQWENSAEMVGPVADRPIDVSIEKAPAREALKRILSPFELTYEIEDAGVVLRQSVPATEWVELFDGKTLNGWRVVEEGEFAKHGEVRVGKGSIVLEQGDERTAIAWTRDFPRADYEITMDVMRVDGTAAFCILVFPIGASQCSLMLAGYGGGSVELHDIDGRHGRASEAGRPLNFESNHWYRVRLKVTEARVQAWIGEEQVIDVATAGHRFTIWQGAKCLGLMGIYTRSGKTALRNIRLRRLTSSKEGGRSEIERKTDGAPAIKETVLEGIYNKPLKIGPGRYVVRGRVSCRMGLLIRPGTEVRYDGRESSLGVEVTFIAEGTQKDPIRIRGTARLPYSNLSVGERGERKMVRMLWCDFTNVGINVVSPERFDLTDSTISGGGLRVHAYDKASASFLRCVFTRAQDLYVGGCPVKVSHSLIDASYINFRDCTTTVSIKDSRLASERGLFVSLKPTLESKRLRFELVGCSVKGKQVNIEIPSEGRVSFLCQKNDFLDLASFSVDWKGVLRAPDNYWGTTNEAEIRQKIRAPKLIYKPFARKEFKSPVGPSAARSKKQ